MALQNVHGVDHVVVVVRDLAAAAQDWGRLGFTVSPPGRHSPQLGTGNHTIMFGEDYLELLGVLAETDHNAPTRTFLANRGEGMERVALKTSDAAAGQEEIRRFGLNGLGPTAFGRPVLRPDGTQTEARFRIFQWPLEEAPAGLRLFACEHLTPEAVWMPELQHHANTARRIVRIEIVSPQPDRDAEHMARLIDAAVENGSDRTFRVASGNHRAEFVLQTREILAERYPGVSLAGAPERGGVGLVIEADDLDAVRRAVGERGVATATSICVPPASANGILLCFAASS